MQPRGAWRVTITRMAPPKKSGSKPRQPQGKPASATPLAPTGSVHLYVGISLDGYIAGPDGGVDWLEPYGDARAGFAPFFKTISACIMGRTTYDHAVQKHGESALVEYGGGMTSYVVTHRPLASKSKSVVPFSGDLRELVAAIRASHPGGDIWLMGGGGVTRSFLEADLVDIMSLAFVPTLLGAGLPMFPPSTLVRERRLQLVSQRTYPSGVVELRFVRAA